MTKLGKETIRTYKLEELVEIQPGYQHKGQMTNDPSGDLACIQVRDLDHDSRVVKPEGIWKMKSPKDLSHYRVSANDLLYLSRGSRAGAYRIEKLPDFTIPLAHFFILRPKAGREMSMTFLWWVLNERKVATQIQSSMKGTMMPFISRAEFQQVQVSVPPKSTQDLVVRFANLRNRERSLVAALEAKKDLLIETLLERRVFGEKNGKQVL